MGHFGTIRRRGPLAGVPITGVLGDQQAALFGQGGLHENDAKMTYGTGLFMLLNTGHAPQFSDRGLLTTVAYQVEGQPPVYAQEGSVAVGGALIQWLRDQLGILGTAAIEKRPVIVTEDGIDSIAIRQMCYLPFTYDHQLIDGADAGRFVTTIKDRIEEGDFEADLDV